MHNQFKKLIKFCNFNFIFKLTYATLRINFPPLVSKTWSSLPVSTLKTWIFPAWLPETIVLSSGEKTIVQISTGPTSTVESFSPDSKSHTLKLESKELDAHSEKSFYIVLKNIY